MMTNILLAFMAGVGLFIIIISLECFDCFSDCADILFRCVEGDVRTTGCEDEIWVFASVLE